MKACVLENINKLEYKDVEKPILKNKEVLLEIKACGICSSDIDRVYKTGTYSFPTIPGHEIVGKIVEIGNDVDIKYLGKKAVVFPLLPCKSCPSCSIGEYSRCENYNYFGSRCNGGFAEYLAVPLWNIVTVDDEIEYEVAGLAEPMAVSLHAVNISNIKLNKVVVVIGTGTIGIIIAQLAKVNGARVIMIGRNQEKLNFIKALGIEEVINNSEYNDFRIKEKYLKNIGADIVFECVGDSRTIEEACLLSKKGGEVILVGNPNNDINLSKNSYWKILRNELIIKGSWNSSYNQDRNDWKTVVELLKNNEFRKNMSKLITHKFLLKDYEKAFEILRNRENFSIKVMLINE